jgi:peptidoglycan hydrolase CwlO-like protein
MKKIIFSLLVISLVGCQIFSSKNTDESDSLKLDSSLDKILINNSKNFELTNQINKQSDSMVTNKVEKTAEKITSLETQVTQLKKENNELKVKLENATDDGKPFNIRTISNN